MEEKEIEKLQKIAEQKRKQLDRQNKYMREKYDRIALMMPKGMREIINNRASEKGYKTITDYLKALVEKDINTDKTPAAAMPEPIPEITPKNSYNPALYAFDDNEDYIPPKKPIEYDYTLNEQLNKIKEEHNL